jgi:hypothetical protein
MSARGWQAKLADPTWLPTNGRVLCLVCGAHYEHGYSEFKTARHLQSRRHRSAAVIAEIDPMEERATRSICEICGGSESNLTYHLSSNRHRAALVRLDVSPS